MRRAIRCSSSPWRSSRILSLPQARGPARLDHNQANLLHQVPSRVRQACRRPHLGGRPHQLASRLHRLASRLRRSVRGWALQRDSLDLVLPAFSHRGHSRLGAPDHNQASLLYQVRHRAGRRKHLGS